MFWFDYDKMLKLVSIAATLDKATKKRIADLFWADTNIRLTFTNQDIYLIGNNDQEINYINILHDVCINLFDIDSMINSAINDDLYYENRTIINNTGSYGTTELVTINGTPMVKKTPKASCSSLDEEYRFARGLYMENSNFFVMTEKDDSTGSYLMEVANDTLFSYVSKTEILDERDKAFIINSLLDEVDYIHKRGFIHNDLHPENILLFNYTRGKQWKLSDFGMAFNLLDKRFIISGLKEESRKSDYINHSVGKNTTQNDIYSIGKLINFVYTKKPQSTNHLFRNISKKCISRKYQNVLDIKREFNGVVAALIE